MIDIETMAVSSNAAILTIGAIKFNRNGNNSDITKMDRFYSRVDMKSCVDVGLKVDPTTIKWWSTQPKEISKEIYTTEDRFSIQTALESFSEWYGNTKTTTHVWGHGSHFDIPIMESAYKACGLKPPWGFWQVRDTRTLYEAVSVERPNMYKNMKHHAMYDAFRQIVAVQNAFKKLRCIK